MSWLNFWPPSSSLIEQDEELTVVSFEDVPVDDPDAPPTSLSICRWCNGPASPSLDECCVRCLEKVQRRTSLRAQSVPYSYRIDFY